MKLISFLSGAAFLGLGVTAVAATFNSEALGSYAAAACVLIALTVVRDYSPRRSCWEPGQARTTRFPATREQPSHRLAA